MSKLSYKKAFNLLVIGVIIIISFIFFRQYIEYGNILKNKKEQFSVDEEKDFETLKNKGKNSLEQIGFSENEINALQEVDINQLTFSDFIRILEFSDNNEVINPEDLIPIKISQHQEEKTEQGVVSINVKPVEAVCFNEKSGNYKTFYTKLHYTVDIKKPMIFQFQDEVILKYNNWYPLFEFTKLYYISSDEKIYEEYVTRKKTSLGDVPFNIHVKQKIDGNIFYLSKISGISILKSPHHLSVYAEYNHKQLLINRALGKHSSEWDWNIY